MSRRQRYNLNKIAQLKGITVININDLAKALMPVFIPGEEAGQGVGYLDDGTMVVVEAAQDKVGQVVSVSVTSVLQTSAGRMIFGRPEGAPPAPAPRRTPDDGTGFCEPGNPSALASCPGMFGVRDGC